VLYQGAVNVPSRCGQGTTVANVLSKAGGSSFQGAVNVPSRCGQGTTVANVLSKAGGSSLISVSMVSVA